MSGPYQKYPYVQSDVGGLFGSLALSGGGGGAPTGIAGGDLAGYYPNPIVKQLTGLGATYEALNPQWVTGGNMTFGGSGGRGIAYKVAGGYGMAIDNTGYCYVTLDGGLTWRKSSYQIAKVSLGADIAYGKYDGVNYGWVFGAGDESGVLKYLPDVAESYDVNGVPLQASWVTVSNSPSYQWADITWVDALGLWIFAGNSYSFLSCPNLSGTTPKFTTMMTGPDVCGGCFWDSAKSVIVTFTRDSGRVYYSSTGAPDSFTEVLYNGTPVLKWLCPYVVPYSGGSTYDGFGAGFSQNGIAAFVGWVRGSVVTTTDVTNASAYMVAVDPDKIPGLYDITGDGVRWFATRVDTGFPSLWELFIGSIPAYRQVVLKKGAVIEGATVLRDLPNATVLGTDKFGTVVIKAPDLLGPIGVELWPYAAYENDTNIDPSQGAHAYVCVPVASFVAKSMAIAVGNASSGTMRLGIYNDDKINGRTKIAETADFTPVQNKINIVPLVTPLQIVGATRIFMAYSLRSGAPNTFTFPCLTNRYSVVAEPLGQLSDPNPTLNTIMYNGGYNHSFRPWMAILG